MKVFVTVNNYPSSSESTSKGWYLLADSAVTNTGKPFYLPEELGPVSVSVCMVWKLSKLGKSISSKFAHRYFSEWAPALHFKLPDYEKRLLEEGLPADASRSFDRSIFIGDFTPVAENVHLELFLNGEKISEFEKDKLLSPVEDIISGISRMNTIKIGDLLVPGLSGNEIVHIGDKLELNMNGVPAFYVKVK